MKTRWTVLLIAPALTLIGVVFLLPFLLLVAMGFWSQPPGSLLVDTTFTTANYVRLATDPYFITAFLRTIWLSLANTAICLVLGFPVARWITRRTPRLRGLLMALMLIPLVCGALLQTLGLVNLLSLLGVVNGALKALGLITGSIRFLGSELGVLIGLVQAFLPLMVLPLVTVLERQPPELEQAARSLGAPAVKVWRRVVLPLAMPGMIAGGVLVFCATLTSFVTPQILGQGKVPTFATIAYQQAALVLDWPFASAFAVVMLVLLLLLVGVAAALRRALRPAVAT